MKPTLVLKIYLLTESLKSDFPNKDFLMPEVAFCAIFWSVERILFKRDCLCNI